MAVDDGTRMEILINTGGEFDATVGVTPTFGAIGAVTLESPTQIRVSDYEGAFGTAPYTETFTIKNQPSDPGVPYTFEVEVAVPKIYQITSTGLSGNQTLTVYGNNFYSGIAMNSLTGIMLMCRKNLLTEINKQDNKVADKLGWRDARFAKQDRFLNHEVSLKNEIDRAVDLLDGVTEGLKEGKLHLTEKLEVGEANQADHDDRRHEGVVDPRHSPCRHIDAEWDEHGLVPLFWTRTRS